MTSEICSLNSNRSLHKDYFLNTKLWRGTPSFYVLARTICEGSYKYYTMYCIPIFRIPMFSIYVEVVGSDSEIFSHGRERLSVIIIQYYIRECICWAWYHEICTNGYSMKLINAFV